MSGIFKEPARGPVEVGVHGLAGDTISDTENRGGPDQAVYVFGEPDHAWWSEELGRDLPPGTFGENLTISRLESADVCIGDRLHIGGAVVLEVTAPRIPCVTLAACMREPGFVKRFRLAERPGVYGRVLRGGWGGVGDEVSSRRYRGKGVLAHELFQNSFDPEVGEGRLRRHPARRSRFAPRRRRRDYSDNRSPVVASPCSVRSLFERD